MKRAAVVALMLAAAPMHAGSVIVARRAALATASPVATRVGLGVLRHGGNAADAAVAAAFALAVAEPQSGNIGGGGFLVYYDAQSRAVWTLDFREVAPAAVTRDTFAGGKGPRRGAIAAGVPGTVAGLAAMHKRFGSRPWEELLAPAIELARDGVRISPDLQTDAVRAKSERNIEAIPDAPLFVQKELAETLERMATNGARDFYRGETAARIVEGVRKAGGILSHTDLREYKPLWRAPIRITFRQFDLYTVPPPSAAGLMIGEELNILGGFDLAAAGFQSAAQIHLLAEAARRAAIDRDRYLGDPASARTPVADLLSQQRAAQWRASIDVARATPTISLTEPATTVAESAHTTHISIVDAAGNAAALTTSLGDDFGSGFLVPRCGFFLNDAMHDFTPGADSANAIASGRRMAASSAPAIVLRRGQPFLVLGTSGGAAIPNIVLQVFLAVTTFGKSLPEAVAAPRYDQQAVPEDMRFEFTHAAGAPIEPLRAMGHGMQGGEPIGNVQAVMIDGSRIIAVADPRHGGAAGGF